MPLLYIGLGSNLGERAQLLAEARAYCQQRLGPLQRISPIYTTAAWGITDQPAFLNQVISVETQLEPHRCLQIVLDTELLLGRQRIQKWGPRLIDIDLLFYDDWRVDTPDLTLPHPFLHERLFVLLPLADIAPVGTPAWARVQQLLTNCPDTSPVELWNPRQHGR